MLLLILPMVEIFACLTAFTEQLPASTVPEPFQVLPYVQNPSQDGFWRHVAGEFGSIASQSPFSPPLATMKTMVAREHLADIPPKRLISA